MAYIININDRSFKVRVEEIEIAKYRILLDDKEYIIDAHKTERDVFSIITNGRSFEVDLNDKGEYYEVLIDGNYFKIYASDEKKRFLKDNRRGGLAVGKQIISAPMPGKVAKMLVKVGEKVKIGDGIVVIEAMKMENELKSPIDGEVKEINVEEGIAVDKGTKLVVVE